MPSPRKGWKMASGAFQVGGRVRVVKDDVGGDLLGRTGTVMEVDYTTGENLSICVSIDTISRFVHNYWFSADELELIAEGSNNDSE